MKSFLLRDIPDELRRKFKETCVRKDVSMKEALIRFMTQFVKEEN